MTIFNVTKKYLDATYTAVQLYFQEYVEVFVKKVTKCAQEVVDKECEIIFYKKLLLVKQLNKYKSFPSILVTYLIFRISVS